jgi:HPt (histidine-containing phosphotransfer) domain-containing protein
MSDTTVEPIDWSAFRRVWGVEGHAAREMLDEFRQDNDPDAWALQAAVEAHDGAEARRLAHRMTGACRTIAAPHIADLCEALGTAARAGQWPRTEELLAQVLRACADLNRYIESL